MPHAHRCTIRLPSRATINARYQNCKLREEERKHLQDLETPRQGVSIETPGNVVTGGAVANAAQKSGQACHALEAASPALAFLQHAIRFLDSPFSKTAHVLLFAARHHDGAALAAVSGLGVGSSADLLADRTNCWAF